MQEKMDFWDFLSDEKNWQIKAEEDAGLLAAKKKRGGGGTQRRQRSPSRENRQFKKPGMGIFGS